MDDRNLGNGSLLGLIHLSQLAFFVESVFNHLGAGHFFEEEDDRGAHTHIDSSVEWHKKPTCKGRNKDGSIGLCRKGHNTDGMFVNKRNADCDN